MIKINYPTLQTAEPVNFHTFSGGEEHVNINIKYDFPPTETITILAQCLDSKTLMDILLVTDALRAMYTNPLALFIPYLPYARQDRRCVAGDAFSLKVFADIINAQKYAIVTCFDAHNPAVAGELINNFYNIPQHISTTNVYSRLGGVDFIVAPDKGATTKSQLWLESWNQLAKRFGEKQANLLQAAKVRNTAGSIVATELLNCPKNALVGKECLIVDDICDGGRTFTELTKILKEHGAEKVYLYVSHGIFSQGINVLLYNGIDAVYTTDSFPVLDDRRRVIKRFYY